MGALQSAEICSVTAHGQPLRRIQLGDPEASGRSSSSRLPIQCHGKHRKRQGCVSPKHRKRHNPASPSCTSIASTATSLAASRKSTDSTSIPLPKATAGPPTPTSRSCGKQAGNTPCKKGSVRVEPSFHMPEAPSSPVEGLAARGWSRAYSESTFPSLTSRLAKETSRWTLTSFTGLNSRSVTLDDASPQAAPRSTVRRCPTPYYADEHLDKDLEVWAEAEMVDDSPQVRQLRPVLLRRPTPKYDFDPEVAVEADKPSMAFLQRHIVLDST